MIRFLIPFLLFQLVSGQMTLEPDSIMSSAEFGTSAYHEVALINESTEDVTYEITVQDMSRTGQNNGNRLPVYRHQTLPVLNIDQLEQDIVYTNEHGDPAPGIRCATPQPTHEENEQVQSVIDSWLETYGTHRTDRDQVNILVAWHVIHNSSGTGDIPDEQIQDQIDVFNDAYNEYGIQFTLDIITRTENNSWFNDMNGFESTYKSQLAVDPVHYFNIYSGNPAGGILGWAFLPSSWPESSYMHGVVLLYSTLPGGTSAPYNQGDTGTHEAGHYLGLRHTFLNGCSPPGDYVDDTPYQSDGNNIYSCNENLDTCTGEGMDPIHNFMNYTDDACLTEFTELQAERMWAQINTYRPGLLENAILGYWAEFSADTVLVSGSSTESFTLALHSTSLDVGQYIAEATFTDVDGVEPTLSLPVTYHVDATPILAIPMDTVFIGDQYAGFMDSLEIPLRNNGAAELTISSITVSDSALTYSGSQEIIIPPFGSASITLFFQSDSTGDYMGSLDFLTNDTTQPSITIPILGSVQLPPIIQVVTDTLILYNAYYVPALPIFNAGEGELHYSLQLEVDILATESLLNESFSSCTMPDGWSTGSTSGVGWQVGEDAGSQGFPIPPATDCYAYINDDNLNLNGMSEVLVFPQADLSNSTSLFLFFSGYFTEMNGQTASVVYSQNNGITWDVIHTISPFYDWHYYFLNLNTIAGMDALVGFQTSDGGSRGSGFAVDNVMLQGAFMQPWLSFESDEGMVGPGMTDSLIYFVQDNGLELGSYPGVLHISSNDPVTPEVEIPVILNVIALATEESLQLPSEYALHDNIPNPFNPTTTIQYDIPVSGNIEISIFDVMGRKVTTLINTIVIPGHHQVHWNGKNHAGMDMPSGMYFASMTTPGKTQTIKMLLMK